jgi:hypothetical protein
VAVSQTFGTDKTARRLCTRHTVTHWWNHGIGDTVTALLETGFMLTGLAEHDTVPWRAFSGEAMVSVGGGEWRLAEMPERLAASFIIQAVKNS